MDELQLSLPVAKLVTIRAKESRHHSICHYSTHKVSHFPKTAKYLWFCAARLPSEGTKKPSRID